MSNAKNVGNAGLNERANVVDSLRKSLRNFLNTLKNGNSLDEEEIHKNVLGPGENNSRITSDFSSDDSLHESIVAFITLVGSTYSVWIFENLNDSKSLQIDLWRWYFYPIVKSYRDVVQRSKVSRNEKPVEFRKSTDRFVVVCKTVSQFYKAFLQRIYENWGCPEPIHPVVQLLKMSDSQSNVTFKEAMSGMVSEIHQSTYRSLCYLGDLARYRSAYSRRRVKDQNQDTNGNSAAGSAGGNETQPSYSLAIAYYTMAHKIVSNEGTPMNQLSQIAYSKTDYLAAIYWELRAIVVDIPFEEAQKNLVTEVKKVLKTSDEDLTRLNIAEVKTDSSKLIMLQLLKLYCKQFNQEVQKPSISHAADPDLDMFTDALQRDYSFYLIKLVVVNEINSEYLVLFALLGICFSSLSEDSGFLIDPSKNSNLSLTLRLFNTILALGTLEDSFLPVLRVFFDWIFKHCDRIPVSEWQSVSKSYYRLFLNITNLLESLRTKHGFKFDPLTAVPTFSGASIIPGNSDTTSFTSSAGNLYEEYQCIGIKTLNCALSDCPSGLDADYSQLSNPHQFRIQCILFSGIQLARLGFLPVKFDENRLQVFSFEAHDNLDSFDEVVLKARRL